MRDKSERLIESNNTKADKKKGIASWFASFFK